MKNILAPTDFSEIADNAVNYAFEFAQSCNASVTLLHCFHIPIISGDALVTAIDFEDLEKESRDLLNIRKRKLIQKYPGVKVDMVSNAGFAAEEIVRYGKEGKVDLIIMGITGSGTFDELLGDTTISVVKNSEIPVLIVPREKVFKKLKNIVITFDRKQIENINNIVPAIELAKQFNSNTTALHIKQRHAIDSTEDYLAEKQIADLLAEIDHRKINFITNVNTIEGIEHYLNRHDVDMLVMLKRKHGFFDQLFHGSNTNKMAFHTNVPLLILHE